MGSNAPSTKQLVLSAGIESLGAEAFETLEPTSAIQPSNTPAKVKNAPVCATQNPIPRNLAANPAKIMVGLLNEVPRWVPGSVIKWAAWSAGFDSKEDAELAAKHLQLAAEKWNEAKVGVTFEWVKEQDDASFVLVYGGEDGGTLAQAFFPNSDPLSYVYVYKLAFDEEYKDNMWKIFTHELGHVLGLRHEFAIEKEGQGAVQFGPRNELSVMNYREELPEIQQTDIDSTKAFYELTKDANGNPPKVKRTPVKDYVPM